jgi:hypothetical protein
MWPTPHPPVHPPTDVRIERRIVPAEELRAVGDLHPNVLIVGPDASVEQALKEIYAVVRPPILSIQIDNGFVLPSPPTGGTLILRDVAVAGPEDQRRLHEWIELAGGAVQVVSTNGASLLPLIERGSFLDSLYYRLNVLYLEIPTRQ